MSTSCQAAAKPKRLQTLFLSALVGTALVLSTSTSQAGDPAAAEALFQAGRALMEKKNYAEACPKLEASYSLDPAIGTKLNLAECFEKQGKLATAWVSWGEARDQAKKEGDKAREDLASKRQKDLDPRVPRLTINVKGPIDGLAIYRDDVALLPATLGVPLPVDPGKHAVTLRRGTTILKEESVESKEKAKDEVNLDATDIPPAPIAPIPTTEGDKTHSPDAKPIMVRKSKGMMAGGIVLASLGAPVFLVGAIIIPAYPGGGIITALVGAGMTGGGIAMAVSGGKKIPKKPETSLFISPTSITLQGTF